MFKKIISFSLTHRLLVILLVSLFVFLGFFSLSSLSRDVLPDLSSPIFKVVVENPGLSSEEVERQITFPLESGFRSLPRVERVLSVSKNGLASVVVKFSWGTNYYLAMQLITQKLSGIAPNLPPGTGVPVVSNAADRLSEVIQYYLVSNNPEVSPMDLRDLADYQIGYRLKAVPGVSSITNMGGEVRQYQVLINQDKLKNYNLSIDEVAGAIRANNTYFSGGFINEGPLQYSVRGLGRIRYFKDLNKIIVATRKGIPIFLRDIATIEIGHQIRQGIVFVNGKEAVTGTVVKQYGVDSKPVIEDVTRALKDLQKELPKGVKLDVFSNASSLIDVSIHNLNGALVLGGIAVILVTLLFLSNLRSTFIVAIILPVTVIITFFFMRLFHYSLDVMSMGGLAVGLGIMVDAAIVDTENIFRHLHGHQDNPLQATIEGALEVRRPVAYATAIIVAVFLPLYSIPGMIGKIFQPFSFTVVTSILVGFVLSLTLTPILCYTLLPKAAAKKTGESWLTRRFEKTYNPALTFSIVHPGRILLSLFIILGITIALFPFIKTGFLPKIDEGAILVKIHTLPGTNLEEEGKTASQVAEILRKGPDVQAVIMRAGRPENSPKTEGANKSETYVELLPWNKRHSSIEQIDQWIRKRTADIPGALIIITTPMTERLEESISGTTIGGQLAVRIFGNDLSTLYSKGMELYNLMAKIKGITDLKIESTTGVPQVNVEIDRIKAAQYGLSPEDIGRDVDLVLQGSVITSVLKNEKTYNIFMRLEEPFRNNIDEISSILIDLPKGGKVSLGMVSHIWEDTAPSDIRRQDMARRIQLSCNSSGKGMDAIVTEIKGLVKQLNLPSGYYVSFGGEYRREKEVINKIETIFGVVIFITFLLLLSAYRSVGKAILIIFFIPFALTGGIFALLITGISLNVSSLIGLLAHFGLTVQKGVLLVEYIIDRQKEGLPLRDAQLLGGRFRMRPVLMTAFSASFAVLPLALGMGAGAEIQQPMAVVLIGGLVTSTLVVLVAMPGMYGLLEKYTEKIQRIFKKKDEGKNVTQA